MLRRRKWKGMKNLFPRKFAIQSPGKVGKTGKGGRREAGGKWIGHVHL